MRADAPALVKLTSLRALSEVMMEAVDGQTEAINEKINAWEASLERLVR